MSAIVTQVEVSSNRGVIAVLIRMDDDSSRYRPLANLDILPEEFRQALTEGLAVSGKPTAPG